MNSKEKLNEFMVEAYNGILRNEEQSLCSKELNDLTISEIHVLEAVAALGEEPKMSTVAATLGRTQGTLTVAVNTLVRKGYMLRQRSTKDKRSISIKLTEKGMYAQKLHYQYHLKLVETIYNNLDAQQIAALTNGLEIIANFFKGGKQSGN